jgi:quinol monooxygenase YgiN
MDALRGLDREYGRVRHPCRTERVGTGTKDETMQYVLIIHEVEDYKAWKQVFDAAADIRREAGERSYQVLKVEADANRIVHFSAWTSTLAAKLFFESPKLIQIRKEAGVKSPEFMYLDQLEAGTL